MTQFLEFRHSVIWTKPAGARTMTPLAVHPGIAEGLYAVATTQSDEQLALPWIGNGELELLGLFLLACGLELAPDTVCRCSPAADSSPAVVAPA